MTKSLRELYERGRLHSLQHRINNNEPRLPHYDAVGGMVIRGTVIRSANEEFAVLYGIDPVYGGSHDVELRTEYDVSTGEYTVRGKMGAGSYSRTMTIRITEESILLSQFPEQVIMQGLDTVVSTLREPFNAYPKVPDPRMPVPVQITVRSAKQTTARTVHSRG